MKLTAHGTTTKYAKRIEVEIECANVAIIFCDGGITFNQITCYEFSAGQLKTIANIAENFRLFYDNLPMTNDQ